jgi:hypothetical protein
LKYFTSKFAQSKRIRRIYSALWERGRLDLTVEALILKGEWKELFTD